MPTTIMTTQISRTTDRQALFEELADLRRRIAALSDRRRQLESVLRAAVRLPRVRGDLAAADVDDAMPRRLGAAK